MLDLEGKEADPATVPKVKAPQKIISFIFLGSELWV